MYDILITGSKGYIGSALNLILKSNYNIIEYDIIDGNDILDLNNLTRIFTIHHIDLVIHLAALSSVSDCNNDMKKAFAVNVTGTKNLLEVMKNFNCTKIIYASTSSVYALNQPLPFQEDRSLTNPCSIYGASKLLAEILITTTTNSYLIMRMFNVVGTSGNKLLDDKIYYGNDRLFTALKSGTVKIYGDDYETEDGTCERDYISLKDTVEAYRLAVRKILSNDIRETINIGTGCAVSVKDLVGFWSNYKSISCIIENRRKGDPPIVFGTIKKAFKILNFRAKKSVEDIIRECLC